MGASLNSYKYKEVSMDFHIPRKPLGTTCRTGEKCPESGVWEVVGYPTTTAPIAKGNTFPPYRGNSVSWRLIQYA